MNAYTNAIDWPAFLGDQDLHWHRLPTTWEAAPFFGNGNLGSMLYRDGDTNRIRLEIFCTDVHDHRDPSSGWTAYSRPRFVVGSFLLVPRGQLASCDWRLNLWDAELTGTITTSQGTISLRHCVHATQPLIITELHPSEGETGCIWEWQPGVARPTRPGVPLTRQDVTSFAEMYGEHYRETLQRYEYNPSPRISAQGDISISVQDLLAGGQYATAWQETRGSEPPIRRLAVSIAHTFPESRACEQAMGAITAAQIKDDAQLLDEHRAWWQAYYPASFVSIPDRRLQAFYWAQIYKLACATRSDGPIMDTSGPWFQPTPWPYITWDLNTQLCYWPIYASNRLELAESLIGNLYDKRSALIDNVRPVEWQEDSAFLSVVSSQDLVEPRDGDMRYWGCMGCLTWALHNCWLHYRHTMDDEMLRIKLLPLLRRAVNFYLHMIETDADGVIHLPPTYSPEYYAPDGTSLTRDCNFDLALLRWGCGALLQACERLVIDDPLIPAWQRVLDRLVAFPADETGFRIGRDLALATSHRHYSHLLMIYPLYLVNREQHGAREIMTRSLEHWIGFEGALAGYSFTGASSMASALGDGNQALAHLKGLEPYLLPNTLYRESGPCMETPLSAAQSIHDMLLQSWGDTIRVFPAAPSAWENIAFADLRAEGAFLVSAVRQGGHTAWVHVKSLAGEPCHVAPDLRGAVHIVADADTTCTETAPGLYTINMPKGAEVTLYAKDDTETVLIAPVPDSAGTAPFGLL